MKTQKHAAASCKQKAITAHTLTLNQGDDAHTNVTSQTLYFPSLLNNTENGVLTLQGVLQKVHF